MASAAEIKFALEGAALDLREDGRACLDTRHSSLVVGVLPNCSGSAHLQTGAADVLVGVVAALAEPEPGAATSGRVSVSVSCGSGDAIAAGLPAYATRGGETLDDKRLWLEAALNQLYSPRASPAALRTLCIAEGKHCWELRAHVQLLRADGCPLDAAALALRSALHATCVPKATVSKASGGQASGTAASSNGALDIELDESLDEAKQFAADLSLPLYVTLASLGGHLVADCTAKERHAAGSALSLALDGEARVCAVCAGGGFGLHLTSLAAATEAARQVSPERHAAAAAAFREATAAREQRGIDDGMLSVFGAVA